MSNHEQRNKNILSRFETETQGTRIAVFDIETACGKGAVMISMHGADLQEATETCGDVFGDNFVSAKART